MANPKTPNTAIARVLTGLGLARGIRKDFTVTGFDLRPDGTRSSVMAVCVRPAAARILRDNAEEIERATAEMGFPFKVRTANHNSAVSGQAVYRAEGSHRK